MPPVHQTPGGKSLFQGLVIVDAKERPALLGRFDGEGSFMKKLLVVFAAGCLGGLANSIAVWAVGGWGIPKSLGVSIAPALTPAWLYPRIVWGGLWGLTFLLPFMKSRAFMKGALLSLLPTLVQLFIVFPVQQSKGIAGIGLGILTPFFVILYNWVWGVATALTIKAAK
jgi:hypothetical protein